MFMEFRCQNEENCECQWEPKNRRFLFSEAQVKVALAKIKQNCWVVPLRNSGQELDLEDPCGYILTQDILRFYEDVLCFRI